MELAGSHGKALQSHCMLSIPAIDTLQRVWKQDDLPQDLGEPGWLTRIG